MDCVLGVNHFDIKGLGFQKIYGFFKIKVPAKGNLGFSVEGVKFGELEMPGEEREGFFTLFQAPFKSAIQIIADSNSASVFGDHSPVQAYKL